MSEDKEFWRGINKAKYKSAGPLKSNYVNIYVYGNKEKTIELFRIGLSNHYNVHKPYLEDCDIYVSTPKVQDFMRFQKEIEKNPDIKFNQVYDWIDKINNYKSWLENIYKPKYKDMDQFFYQVYLWVKGDLDLFGLYCGIYTEIIYQECYDDNYDNASIDKKIIIDHEYSKLHK